METLKSCPICSSPSSKTVYKLADYSITHEEFTIVECANCGFNYTNPRPALEKVEKYYDSDEYISHSNRNESLIDFLYQLVRKRTLASKRKLVCGLSRGGKLLDYGCGTGEFLAHMASRGFSVQGIEPGLLAREQAVMNHGLNVLPTIGEITATEQFNTVTMWHVLEHVHNLRTTIKWLYASLSQSGHLIVAVPNISSTDSGHYDKYWAALDVPRHLYHFRELDIDRLFTEHGFRLISTRPMWYDAIYISILSEKYKGRSRLVALIGGTFWGMISNLAALFTKKPTSSTIYIFEKSPI